MDSDRVVMYEQEIPDVLQAVSKVHQTVDSHGFDSSIYHLVMLRASQVNCCGYCVKMHTKDARENGESSDRLDQIVVWDQGDEFNEREKVALAWTEALTKLEPKTSFGALRAELREHFTEKEISLLTVNITMINLWNRIRVSGH